MFCRPGRFTSFVFRAALVAGVALSTLIAMHEHTFAQLQCPLTLSDALGVQRTQELRRRIEAAERRFRPASNVVPDEVAHTVSESLPLLRRADLLNPVRPKPRIYVDTYHGNNLVSSPDVHVLPADDRTLCLLQPGRAVFLSDEVTHHYALVYAIDYRQKTVTLLDPWARRSFLLSGNNFIGVKARNRVGPQGQPLLDLSFDEFLRALHGEVEEFIPELAFAGLEALYPEMASKEDYLVWKYSRLLATDSFQVSFPIVLQLSSRNDLHVMPRLRLLSLWADDYIAGVMSSFSVPKPGIAAKEANVPILRNLFLVRLDEYAKVLPWTLKWLLLQRTRETGDTELRLAILDSFLKFEPADVDFQIARAETLLRQGRIDEAISQLERSDRQWKAEVTSVINKSTADEAEVFLFAKDYGLQSLAVLHWRRLRIALLHRIAQLQQNSLAESDHDAAMALLQKNYVIGSLLIDFFPEVMRAAYLAKARSTEELYIQTIIRLPDDQERLQHFGLSLFRLFSTTQSISEISGTTATALRRSAVGRELCDIRDAGRIVPGMIENLTNELKSFCDRRLTRPSNLKPAPRTAVIESALHFGARTSKENAYCGSFFAISLDREH